MSETLRPEYFKFSAVSIPINPAPTTATSFTLFLSIYFCNPSTSGTVFMRKTQSSSMGWIYRHDKYKVVPREQSSGTINVKRSEERRVGKEYRYQRDKNHQL